jgi:hypothetical protein
LNRGAEGLTWFSVAGVFAGGFATDSMLPCGAGIRSDGGVSGTAETGPAAIADV